MWELKLNLTFLHQILFNHFKKQNYFFILIVLSN